MSVVRRRFGPVSELRWRCSDTGTSVSGRARRPCTGTSVMRVNEPIRLHPLQLLPQAQLPTGGACCNPVLRLVEDGDSRHGGDPAFAQIVAQLRQLRAVGCIHVHKAIHVANDQLLVAIARVALPLRTQDSNPATYSSSVKAQCLHMDLDSPV